jgi:hypothetical protein
MPLRQQSTFLIVGEHDVPHWINFKESLLHKLRRPEDISPDVALCSLSCSADELRDFASKLELVETDEIREVSSYPPPPPRRAPFTFMPDADPREWVAFDRSYGIGSNALVQVFRRKTTISVDSPVRFYRAGSVLLRFAGGPVDLLPRKPSVARLVESNAEWRESELQLATFALDHHRFDISIPEPDEVLNAVLADAGLGLHHLSGPGQIADALLA